MGKQLICVLLALCLALVLAACGGVEAEIGAPSAPGEAMAGQAAKTIPIPDYRDFVKELLKENEHTIGWLEVPGTAVDDVVVYYPQDNKYYKRRNFEQEYSFNGLFYADYRSEFGDGTGDTLGLNTCIYGHTLSDYPDNKAYSLKFGTLHNFRDPAFAREVPYIYFSTGEEAMAFEIISVFIANADNPALPYNRNDVSPEQFIRMIEEEVFPRSLYDYGVTVSEEDRFLTLSTCIQHLEDGTTYPLQDQSMMRFAIMARLVEPEKVCKTGAEFEVNPEPVIDTDGLWRA